MIYSVSESSNKAGTEVILSRNSASKIYTRNAKSVPFCTDHPGLEVDNLQLVMQQRRHLNHTARSSANKYSACSKESL